MKTNFNPANYFAAFLIYLIPGNNSFAQYSAVEIENKQCLVSENAAAESGLFQAEFIGFRNVPSLDLQWQPVLAPKGSADGNENYENMVPDPERLKKLKKELREQPLQGSSNENNKNGSGMDINVSVPQLGQNFGTLYDSGSGSPTDNTVAISNGGWIVSAINAMVCYTNEQGVISYNQTLKTWINDPVLPVNKFLCDPAIIYDSGADRFVSFVKTCDNSTSYIILGFSKTNNPNDGWYFYRLTGNPLNDNSWGDLPKIAISNEEVFVAINLYINNTNWNQAVVYQVSKRDAYNGKSPQYKVWSKFAGTPFTLTPLSWGQQGNYGPGIYLICSGASSSGGSNLLFYQITDTLNAPGAKVNYYNIPVSPSFSVPSNATQKGNSWPIGTADCRSKGGFYLNGIAHFVFTSNYTGGYSGINYVRLDVKTTTPTMKRYGASGMHYGFPAIASFGSTINDQSVIIGCDYVDANSFPGIKALFCDNSMNFAATPIDVKTGDSYVKYPTSSSPERWGDYSGAWRKCNGSSVWLAGMYGRTDHYWGQWLAEIKDAATPVNNLTGNSNLKVNVYPNPVSELFKIDFSIKKNTEVEICINDVQGKLLKELYSGVAVKGENTFTFNKGSLNAGVYFLTVQDDSRVLRTEKIIIGSRPAGE